MSKNYSFSSLLSNFYFKKKREGRLSFIKALAISLIPFSIFILSSHADL
ncbi:hypothetical protein DB42_EA01140 [Neochlamydia sp. EPS4]|nr:hypothetical protein DB42_EA01140 [Neochlamydia sp. EPS4]